MAEHNKIVKKGYIFIKPRVNKGKFAPTTYLHPIANKYVNEHLIYQYGA